MRRTYSRTVFLAIGAAIFVAFGLLEAGPLSILWRAAPRPAAVALVVVAALVPPSLVAVVPVVRELEVLAGRALLHPVGELWESGGSRWRAVGFVLAHLAAGGAAGTALAIGVPQAFTWAYGRWAAAGSTRLGDLSGAAASVLFGIVLVLAVVGAVALTVLLGLAVARLAPLLLGPSDRDRLVAAEQRLAAEAEHRRLARDLHDGIGHALSVITLQAGAGQVARDPEQMHKALQTVEQVARSAVADLDDALGVLRQGQSAPRAPVRSLGDVPDLVRTYVSGGLPVDVTLADPGRVPDVVSREGFRVVQEALTNAERHGRGPVTMRTLLSGEALVIEIDNPVGARTKPRVGGGHGLAGLRERVRLVGGKVSVGPDGDRWRMRVELPVGPADD